jgi:hypothetical protein
MSDGDVSAGPLAEFAALRAEILQHEQNINQISYAAANAYGNHIRPATDTRILWPPEPSCAVVSYLLYLRYVDQALGIIDKASFIRSELSPRVPGGLRREDWLSQRSNFRPVYGRISRLLTFPAVSLTVLVWAYPMCLEWNSLALPIRWLWQRCGSRAWSARAIIPSSSRAGIFLRARRRWVQLTAEPAPQGAEGEGGRLGV